MAWLAKDSLQSSLAQLSQIDPMILGTIDHAARYEALHPLFAPAFAFLRSMTGSEAPGRHEIAGDDVFALVQEVRTIPAEQAQFEAHQVYIDIQFVLRGRETILWAPLASMKELTRPYDAIKDIAKWSMTSDVTPLHLTTGRFAILYPEDAHAPCVEWDQSDVVFKTVIKVRAAL